MYESTGNGYEAARYGDPYKELYRQMRNETLLNFIDKHFGKGVKLKILEIGCGTGLTLEYMATISSEYELYGLDFSHTMLIQAYQKLKGLRNGFRLVLGDSLKLPFPDSTLNVVYSTRFIHQFTHEQKKKLYKEMLRVLQPGGLIITEFYSRHGKWSRYLRRLQESPTLEQCPSISEVSDIVGAHYSVHPVRMMGLKAINNLCGEKVLRRLTSISNKPVFRMLAEEYFVATVK